MNQIYRYAPDFGITRINRHCFDVLWRHVQWSHQQYARDDGKSHGDHWWKLVEEFVTDFNQYRTQLFYPLDLIYADDYISRWYGQGGHWINWCFPMFVANDRKLENGADI